MSQHEISILTPVGKHHAAYLPQAWESIRRQQIPAPWLVRWYVQEDGPPSPAQSFVQTLDSKVAQYAASGLSGGAAEARNLALARAHGEMVMLLDADDELAPDAVARVVSQLESGFMWCGFAAVDNQQGTLVQRDGRYSARLSSDATKAPNSDAFVPSEWMGGIAARSVAVMLGRLWLSAISSDHVCHLRAMDLGRRRLAGLGTIRRHCADSCNL